MLDHHNGKNVVDVNENGIFLEDGVTIETKNIRSTVPIEIVGAKLLKVDKTEGGNALLVFGHPREDQEPLIIASVEATEVDLTGANG